LAINQALTELSQSGLTLALEVINPQRVTTPPEKISNPLIRAGVQFSSNGKIEGYWVRTQDVNDINFDYEYKWEFYPRFDKQGQPRIVHVFERQFPNQHRGIPWMASALNRIKDLDDWYEAELVAKQIEACFGLIFTGGPDSISPYDVAAANSNESTSTGKQLEDIQPGMVHYAAEGESVTTIDPQRPGGTFAPFVERTIRSIAATLNIPYELIAKDYFRTTFSSGQLAMLDGRVVFKMRRQVLVDGLLIPLWSRFVDGVVFANEADGTIDITQYAADKTAFTTHVWVAPGWGFINPRDEVNAIQIALESNVTNLSTVYSEKGEDVEVELEKRRVELLRLAEIEVEVRAYKRDLEEAAGLPSEQSENDPSQPENGSSSGNQDSSQSEEDSVVENQSR
jgi:lambda family phage portal protein